ncbi:MAG TPA: sigma-70 family RNA polymerase sigma factor [Streptosporangiaceae bacterium]|nr:sigma-70 family RNA polymerase sigma factor [Streptosporangiaceae bacterium]
MTEADWLASRFEEQRPRLRAVAYRMLGSLAEADDAVQNSWLRLSGADTADVQNLDGWLTTVVARECLKLLRGRRHRQEEPLDETGAKAPTADSRGDPEAAALLADAVGPALMVVLDTLGPAERLAFVLHDVFAVPFDDIAAILERSPAATRQLASRARRRVRGAAPPSEVDLARQRRVVGAFLAALREGDFEGLIAVLDPDVLFLEDTTGLRPGAAALLHGSQAVATHAVTFSPSARFVEPALVYGLAGLAIVPGGHLVGALAFRFRDGKIAEIQAISRASDLRYVDLARPADG